MGPRTEAAIRAFREASGIPEPFSDPWCLNAVLSRLHTLSIRTNTTPEAAVLEAAIEDLLTPETLRRQRRLAANWFEERNCEALRGLPAEALGDLTLENCVQARTREQQEQLAARYFQQRDCSALAQVPAAFHGENAPAACLALFERETNLDGFRAAIRGDDCDEADRLRRVLGPHAPTRAAVLVGVCRDTVQRASDETALEDAIAAGDCDAIAPLEDRLGRTGAGAECRFNALLTTGTAREMLLAAALLEADQEPVRAIAVYRAMIQRFPQDDLALQAAQRLTALSSGPATATTTSPAIAGADVGAGTGPADTGGPYAGFCPVNGYCGVVDENGWVLPPAWGYGFSLTVGGLYADLSVVDGAFPMTDEGNADQHNPIRRTDVLGILLSSGGTYGLRSLGGNWVIPPTFQNLGQFAETGLAAARLNDRWGLVDRQGNWAVTPRFQRLHSFDEAGLARAQLDDRYGFVDAGGQWVIQPRPGYIAPFGATGLTSVTPQGRPGLIDRRGNWVIPPLSDADLDAVIRQSTDTDVIYAHAHSIRDSNPARAFEFYRRAADLRDGYAQNRTGYMYDIGEGVTESDSQAVRYYRLVAEQGVAAGQFNLGLMLVYGLGTAQDSAAARTWLNRARENGYEDTRAVQSILDDLRERDRSAPTYTPPTYTPPVQQAPPPQRLPASGAGPDCAHTREPIKRAQFSGVGSAGQDVRRLSEGHQRKPLYRDCASAEHRHRPHPGHAVF
ncbi:MAG: SEL1-like repeat protein [Rhodobacteraceae bacterium]|nr:SEL1-like repeat protein [Paracoccaceae bacterium]